MPPGDKSKYTDKQVRKAEDIEQSYERRGDAAQEGVKPAPKPIKNADRGNLEASGTLAVIPSGSPQ